MLNTLLEKKIRKAPHKILLTPTEEVTEFDLKLKNQAQRMLFVTHQCEGIGLAANQLGFSNSMFVYIYEGTNHVCINPVCTIEPGQTQENDEEKIEVEQEKEVGIEGCLSIPNRWLYVPRYKSLRLSYQNLSGKRLEREIEGYEARVVQHEMDHLAGRLITDYEEEK